MVMARRMCSVRSPYEVWKSSQNQQPVTVLLLDEEGREYVSIADGASGPALKVRSPEDR
jgi:hypothetical protein